MLNSATDEEYWIIFHSSVVKGDNLTSSEKNQTVFIRENGHI